MSAKEIPRKFKDKNGDQIEKGMKDPTKNLRISKSVQTHSHEVGEFDK